MKRKQNHEKTTHEEINRTVLKLTVRKFKITMNNILKAVVLPKGQLGLRKCLATSGDNFGIIKLALVNESKGFCSAFYNAEDTLPVTKNYTATRKCQ